MKKLLDQYHKISEYYIRHHKFGAKKKVIKKDRVSMAKMAGIPEPDHKYGYTDKHIKTFMKTQEYKKFNKWLRGQTCAMDEKTGQLVIYEYDVTRFIDMVRRGAPTLWD